MKLLPESLQQEAALAALTAGYVLWYLDTQALPMLLRESKLQAVWAAGSKRYHENIWKFNYSYDRELRHTAVSKNQVLEHLHHTPEKTAEQHVLKMIETNKKIYNAFSPSSKRLLIWQTQPSLH